MSNNKKIVDTMWINTPTGCIGIVLIDNGFEKKAYMKQVLGLDEQFDIQDVAQNGGKILINQAEKIFNHLKDNGKI